MTETTASLCKNCGHTISDRFCGHCGQKADIHRITWHELEHQFRHALLHLDGGILYTIKELATRPGHTIREYMLGKRKSHYNPFLLLIITAGFCSLLYTHFHIATTFASVRLDRLQGQSATVAHKFFAIRMVFFCILFSTGDTLLFRRNAYTFPEMAIFNAFSLCGVSIIQLLFVPLLIAGGRAFTVPLVHIALVVCVLAYLWWTRMQFFEAYQNRRNAVLVILSLLLYLAVVACTGLLLVPILLRLL